MACMKAIQFVIIVVINCINVIADLCFPNTGPCAKSLALLKLTSNLANFREMTPQLLIIGNRLMGGYGKQWLPFSVAISASTNPCNQVFCIVYTYRELAVGYGRRSDAQVSNFAEKIAATSSILWLSVFLLRCNGRRYSYRSVDAARGFRDEVISLLFIVKVCDCYFRFGIRENPRSIAFLLYGIACKSSRWAFLRYTI